MFKSEPIKLVLTATTVRGLSVATHIEITVHNPPPPSSFAVRVTGQYSQTLSYPEALHALQKKTSQYLFGNEQGVYFIEAARHSTSITVKIGFCNLVYDPCDKKNTGIITTKLKVNNVQSGVVNPAFALTLTPDIQLSTIMTIPSGPCSEGDNPPVVTRLIPDATFEMCSAVKYKIDPDTFTDIEDGNNLTFVLTSINNILINEAVTWIYATSNKEVLATISSGVRGASPTYTINVRGYDKKQQYADTTWHLRITGSPRKAYHTFKMVLTPKLSMVGESKNPSFVEKYKLVSLLNSFFNGNVTDIKSLDQVVGENGFTFVFSSCTLPDYCDPNGAQDILRRLQSQTFKDHISSHYTLTRAEVHSLTACNGPLNPPTPSRITWDVEVNVCGGSIVQVPTNMFIDTEDGGGTRNLTLKFTFSSASSLRDKETLPAWMRFDAKSQTLSVLPTRQEASEFTKTSSQQQIIYRLTAIDSSGLSTSIVTRFKMNMPPQEAKYKFQFQFRSTVTTTQKARTAEGSEIETRALFVRGIAEYMKSSLDTISIESFSRIAPSFSTDTTTTDTFEIVFSNCSINYSPSCDLASLRNLKNSLIDQNNFPRPSFRAVMMTPTYNLDLLLGLVSIEPPCTETYNPPQIQNPISNILVTLCGSSIQTFTIPENTFYDPQDGMNLKYTMSTLQGGPLVASQSWITFDSVSRTIRVFPLLSYEAGGTSTMLSKRVYSVTVTDSSNLQASTPVHIEITGALDIFKECQIQLVLKRTATFDDTDIKNDLINTLSYLNKRLKTFFQLADTEDIAFVQYSSSLNNLDRITVSFSYCSPLYTTTILKVDYQNLANKILKRIFQTNDRQSLTTSFKGVFGGKYIVESARTLFTGRCSNLPPVTPDVSPVFALTLPFCGYVQQTIEENQFYDFEDGSTSSLTLELYAIRSEEQNTGGGEGMLSLVHTEHWINIDSESRSIIAVANDQLRSSSSNIYKFLLRATDKSGAYLDIPLTIFTRSTSVELAPFDITFEARLTTTPSSNSHTGNSRNRPMVYELMYLIQRIKTFYGLAQNPSVSIKRYTESPGFPRYRSLTWTLCTGTQCNENGVLDKTKTLFSSQLKALDSSFVSSFEPMFKIERVHYMSARCTVETDPPFVQSMIPTLQPNFCSMFTYKLPTDLFYDKENGEMQNLRVSLLDNAGNPVGASSSMIQLNRAGLQLFGVNVQATKPRTRTYQIAVTNSKKLTRKTPFRVQYQSTPYITGCPVHVRFSYKHITSTTTDLDVLVQIMNSVTRYYGDRNVMIKVLDFKRVTKNIKTPSETTDAAPIFEIQWTNCTFKQTTPEKAIHGLTESKRDALTSIFSKV